MRPSCSELRWKMKFLLFFLFSLLHLIIICVDGQCLQLDPMSGNFKTVATFTWNKTENSSFESPFDCKTECGKLLFPYAAIQDARFCFCGDKLTGSDSNACLKNCQDGSKCGGEDPNGPIFVYEANYVEKDSLPELYLAVSLLDNAQIKQEVKIKVNSSGDYYVDWGDYSTPELKGISHTYDLPGLYKVTVFTDKKSMSTFSFIRIHDTPSFSVQCPPIFEVNVSQECNVTSIRQGYDFRVSWNLTQNNFTKTFAAEIPSEMLEVYGSNYITDETLTESSIALEKTLIILPNSLNQKGGQVTHITYAVSAYGSVGLYVIIPKCSLNLYCGSSGSCEDVCLSPESPFICRSSFCVVDSTCNSCPTKNAPTDDVFDPLYLMTIEITTDDLYSIPDNIFIPAGVEVALGCLSEDHCPSGPVTFKTRPIGLHETEEKHFFLPNRTMNFFNKRHIIQILMRNDAQIDVNFNLTCTRAVPFPLSDVTDPSSKEAEEFVFKGGKFSLEYGIYSSISGSLQKETVELLCQERILSPVIEDEIWIKLGEAQPFHIHFTQGSPIFNTIEMDRNFIYNYLDRSFGGWNLTFDLVYNQEGLHNLTGNSSNLLNYVLFRSLVHVVPPVTDNWTVEFHCPCYDFEEGFLFKLFLPATENPPWNASFMATFSNGDLVFPFEVFDFGTYENDDESFPIKINRTLALSAGFYTITIYLENEVSNTTIVTNLTVEGAIFGVSAIFKWNNSGIIEDGMGNNKNMVLVNATAFVLPSVQKGNPKKWRMIVNETGYTVEVNSLQNFTLDYLEAGNYTVIVSAYNAVQGWVDSSPLQLIVIDTTQGFSISDDGAVTTPLTVEETIFGVSAIFKWNNSGIIKDGMGPNKNMILVNATAFVLPSVEEGNPEKWRMIINETGYSVEVNSLQNFTLDYLEAGKYTVIVSAYNAVQGWVDSSPLQMIVIDTMQGFSISDDGAVTNPGQVKIIEGNFEVYTPFTCVMIDFGDGSKAELYGNKETCLNNYSDLPYKGSFSSPPVRMRHVYQKEYVYDVKAIAFDEKVRYRGDLSVVVGDMPCSMPDIKIVDSAKSVDIAKDFWMSLQIVVRAEANYTCNDTDRVIKFERRWTVMLVDPETEEPISVVIVENVLPTWNFGQLVIRPTFLNLGTYLLTYSFRLKAHPVLYLERSDYTYINVVPSPLRPIIILGSASRIKRSYGQFVNLEPSLSYDPDYPQSQNHSITLWCRQLSPKADKEIPIEEDGTHHKMNEQSIPTREEVEQRRGGGCFGRGPGVIRLPPELDVKLDTLSLINPEASYEFLLEMKKDSRNASVKLIVDIVIEPTPSLIVNCKAKEGCEDNACSATAQGLVVNPTKRLALQGTCTDDCGNQLQYEWIIKTTSGDPVEETSGICGSDEDSSVIDLKKSECEEVFLTSKKIATFVISPQFFIKNKNVSDFIFKISGTTDEGYNGYTEIMVIANKPPEGGVCQMMKTSGQALFDQFPVGCTDWIDPEGIGVSSYTYYYWIHTDSGSLKKVIAITGKSQFSLILPVGEFDLYVDITDRLYAITSFYLGKVSSTLPANNIGMLLQLRNSIPILEKLAAIGDQTILCMTLMALSSVRDEADTLPIEVHDVSNLTDEILKEIGSIADLNNKQLTALQSAASFSTLDQINTVVNALQSILEGIFKKVYGAYTIDMHGRELSLFILQQMIDNIPNVCIISPYDMESFLSFAMDSMSAIITGINIIISSEDIVPPSDMLVADNWDYNTDITLNMVIPPSFDAMLKQNVYETTKVKAGDHVDQIFNLVRKIEMELLKLTVVGENIKAHAPNGASALISKVDESIFIAGLTVEAKENMNTSIMFPIDFCPSLASDLSSKCNNVIGLTTEIWPCITHAYVTTSNVLSKGSKTIDVMLRLDGKELSISEMDEPLLINIPRESEQLPDPVNVSVSEYIREGTPFVYHTFNVTNFESSYTIEITPEKLLAPDDNLVILIDFERMPTPPKYMSKILIRELPVNNGVYSYFVGTKENGNKTGRFFIAVAMLKSEFVNLNTTTKDSFIEFNLIYSLRVFTSGCYYFDMKEAKWTGGGMHVVKATPQLTTCATNHLTPFSFGFFPSVNKLDFEFIFANTGFIDNLSIYLVLIIVSCLYIMLMIWAYFQDLKDIQRRGVLPLLDNKPEDKYLYELTFYTGPDAQASTDSNIYFILSGDCDETEVRRLPPAENKLYRRFGVNSFVMTTPAPLGQLNYLRVFHDNTGEPPLDGWQLQMVIVRDLQLHEKYIFDINDWLAFYRGNGKIDKTFTSYEGKDEKSFSQNLYIKSNKSTNQDHMWLSIFMRPIGSRFDRKERVSVCFAFLYLSMLTDALWYNREEESPRGGYLDWGIFTFSLEQLLTGVCILIIVFPFIYLLILIFKRARPKSLRKCRAFDALENQRQNYFSENDFEIPNEDDITEILVDENKEARPKDVSPVKCIPWWMRIIAWIFIVASIGVSIFFVWSYGIMWGEIKTVKWFSSFIITFLVSVLLSEWLKVIIYSFASTICSKVDLSTEDIDCDEEVPSLKQDEEWLYKKKLDPTQSKKVHRVIGVDIENNDTTSIQERMKKEYDTLNVLKEVFAYCIFLFIVFTLVNGRTDYNGYLLQKHLTQTFVTRGKGKFDFSMVKTSNEWWLWSKNVILQELRSQRGYNNDPPYGLRGYLNDRANRIMGYALIRQIRTKRNTCKVTEPMNTAVKSCSGSRGISNEETKDFCAGWILNDTYANCDWEEFKYKTASELETYPWRGRIGVYSGGGYVLRLSGVQEDLIRRMDDLQQNQWINKNTRAVILEFSVYNANANLFCLCTVVAEFKDGGGIITKWRFDPIRLIKDTGAKGFLTTICEIGFIVSTVFFTLRELWKIKNKKLGYFSSYWNLAEICIILISYVSIGLYVYRYILTERALTVFNETEGNGYVRIDTAAYIDQVFLYSCAAIVFFSTLKLIKLLQFNKRMDALALTIRGCWDDLKIFLIIFSIVFFGFSCLFFFMFTAHLEEFARIVTAIQMSFQMMMGKFEFEAMKNVNFFSPLLFFVFSVINSMVLIDIMLTIILQSFAHVKMDLMKRENKLNVIDYVWTAFRRFIRKEQLPQIHVKPDFNDKPDKRITTRNENSEQLPDKVSILLKYINNMYFDGRLDINSIEAKKKLMNYDAKRILPFHDPSTYGKRSIKCSEE